MDTNALLQILVALAALTNQPPVAAGPSVSIPINWNTIITVLGGVALAWLNYRTNKKVEKVGEKVQVVAVTTDKTEKLVNSQSGDLKRNYEVSTALNATLAPSPENAKLAKNAAKAVAEHDANQGRADQVQAVADAKVETKP